MSGQLIMHYAHFSQEDISKELVYGFIPPMLFFGKTVCLFSLTIVPCHKLNSTSLSSKMMQIKQWEHLFSLLHGSWSPYCYIMQL